MIPRHERFRSAGQLRGGDLGIGLPDQLLLTGTRVTQHGGDVGALIGHLVVPLGDRLGLLGQHRPGAVCLVEALRIGGIAERRVAGDDLLVDAVPCRRASQVGLLLGVPVRSIGRFHVRLDDQPPIRAR
ncbi:hypothetical protein AWB94_25945 [Mycolicibacterium canariasense]|nr:hypothetical protein AWB94_25945 [Mycolicibacterium canariasense]